METECERIRTENCRTRQYAGLDRDPTIRACPDDERLSGEVDVLTPQHYEKLMTNVFKQPSDNETQTSEKFQMYSVDIFDRPTAQRANDDINSG